jgi:two-component system, OmpR family, alkaline phosphatase synthesis response regulator PhoP
MEDACRLAGAFRIPHLAFGIWHLAFGIWHLAFHSAFCILHSAFCIRRAVAPIPYTADVPGQPTELPLALIVEDDEDIAGLLAYAARKAGCEPVVVHDGAVALGRIRAQLPAVLLLDRMLPGLDGLEVCRALRADERTASLPIIMITARAEEAERVAGLEGGADDYVTKPFSPNELVARIRAMLRRHVRSAPAGNVIRYGAITVDLDRHVVSAGEEPVHLTAKEFLLLRYFLEHQGRVLSRDLLLSDVWGYTYTGGTRTVDVHVRRLREKLPAIADAIVTVTQFGYKLAEIQR